ncbi:MAG: hypothetical protein K0R51_2944 [Cytophagaceae bacterium]|jgi:hypothetical protein|nr:hypothetical protein [Cytophagaceae bacterium]
MLSVRISKLSTFQLRNKYFAYLHFDNITPIISSSIIPIDKIITYI